MSEAWGIERKRKGEDKWELMPPENWAFYRPKHADEWIARLNGPLLPYEYRVVSLEEQEPTDA